MSYDPTTQLPLGLFGGMSFRLDDKQKALKGAYDALPSVAQRALGREFGDRGYVTGDDADGARRGFAPVSLGDRVGDTTA